MHKRMCPLSFKFNLTNVNRKNSANLLVALYDVIKFFNPGRNIAPDILGYKKSTKCADDGGLQCQEMLRVDFHGAHFPSQK